MFLRRAMILLADSHDVNPVKKHYSVLVQRLLLPLQASDQQAFVLYAPGGVIPRVHFHHSRQFCPSLRDSTVFTSTVMCNAI